MVLGLIGQYDGYISTCAVNGLRGGGTLPVVLLCWLCFAVLCSYKLTLGSDGSTNLMTMTQTFMIICVLMQRKYIHGADKKGQHMFYVCNITLEHRSMGQDCTSGNIWMNQRKQSF